MADTSPDAAGSAPVDWSRCTFGAPEPITGLGFVSGSEFGLTLSQNGLELVLSSSSAGNEDLYRTTRGDRGSAFSAASAVAGVNTSAVEGTPFLAAAALDLYFTSNRSGGRGARDLYVARRADSSSGFANPQLIAEINSALSDQYPRVSADELTLNFTSARAGGKGANDLWIARRATPSATFADALPLTELNGTTNDEGGVLTSDGRTMFFSSDRLGTLDIYIATRSDPDAVFSTPSNLSAINTSRGEFNLALTSDDRELFFTSDRDGGNEYHVFRSLLDCP